MGPFELIFINSKAYRFNSWHDEAYRWNISGTWAQRGGSYYGGLSAGIFSYTTYDAIAVWDCSYRLVLTPTNN